MLHRPSTQTGADPCAFLWRAATLNVTLNGKWSIISGQRSHGGGFHERRGRTASTLKGLLGFRTAASSGFRQKMNNSWGWKFTVSRSDIRTPPVMLARTFWKALKFTNLQMDVRTTGARRPKWKWQFCFRSDTDRAPPSVISPPVLESDKVLHLTRKWWTGAPT